MLDIPSLASIAFIFIVAFLVTFVTTPMIANAMKRRGITGKDVHKLAKTEVPEMCGLAILLGLATGTAAYMILFPTSIRVSAAFVGTVLIAGAIGFVDDLRPLGARIKPVLTATACLPILILRTYNPFPLIPLIGRITLTLLYPFLILLAIAVTSNAVNMMDVMNGSMPGTVAIITVAVIVVLLASGDVTTAALAAGLLAAMLAFYYYNRFPAKVFGGDTGSLAVGAALGALSILGKIETVMMIALIPHIMNAFYGLSSVGGLYERREIRQRPTKLLRNGTIEASATKGAPVTLARLILAAGPLGERQIVRGMMFLTLVSSVLAVLTYWVTLAGRV
jgi:UDP-N-acetylglucosamine--dolichyl-phosphate N-acetylglucosaminephosphotransferase